MGLPTFQIPTQVRDFASKISEVSQKRHPPPVSCGDLVEKKDPLRLRHPATRPHPCPWRCDSAVLSIFTAKFMRMRFGTTINDVPVVYGTKLKACLWKIYFPLRPA